MSPRAMAFRLRVPLLALLALALAGAPAARAADMSRWDPKTLTVPPLRRIQVPKIEHWRLPNGITVFLLENHELPRVSGRLYVRMAPAWIPAGKVGLGTVTGQVLRSGGTAAHPGDWLDDRLAAIGASIESDVNLDLGRVDFHCLTENLDEVLGLYADVLRRPAFPEEKIELARVGLRQAIASRNDEMVPVLQRVAGQAVYGKDSPYARQPEYATVDAITREDCLRLHRELFEPGRAVLAVFGDFRSADLKRRLAARLGDWKGAGVPLPPAPPVPGRLDTRLLFAPKEDVTQSGIVLAHLGFRADDPDLPAMDVYQMALGGGFQSRLIKRIRTERGLAYSTGAISGEGYSRPGVFFAYSLTRGESTMTALALLREEVKRSIEAPFTAEELEAAKQSVQNAFVFNFEAPSAVLFRAAYYQVLGYPLDFLERYQKGLEGVDAASVLAAARRKVHPDAMVAVVVGREKDFDHPLDSMGLPVERVDIRIPPPPGAAAHSESSAASDTSGGAAALARGQEWLRRAAEQAGGPAAFAAVRSIVTEQETDLHVQGQSAHVTSISSWVLPDRLRVELRTPMGSIVQGFDGSHGWMSQMGHVEDDPRRAAAVREQYERSLFRIFAHPEQLQVRALEAPRTVDGRSYRIARVASEVVPQWSLLFDADGRLARMEYETRAASGPVREVQLLEGWAPEGALRLPHLTQALQNGASVRESKVTAYRINVPLPDSLFRKPGP